MRWINNACKSVVLYNQNMGAVDANDQLRGYYHIRLRFYKYMYWFMFDVSVTNTFVLCKHFTDLGMKTFRKELALCLIGDYLSRRSSFAEPDTVEALLCIPFSNARGQETTPLPLLSTIPSRTTQHSVAALL